MVARIGAHHLSRHSNGFLSNNGTAWPCHDSISVWQDYIQDVMPTSHITNHTSHTTHKQPDLRVMVLLLRLTLSGVVGRVTAHDWVPHLRRQLLLEAVVLFHEILRIIFGILYVCEFCPTVSSCQAASTSSCLLRSWRHCTLRRGDMRGQGNNDNDDNTITIL